MRGDSLFPPPFALHGALQEQAGRYLQPSLSPEGRQRRGCRAVWDGGEGSGQLPKRQPRGLRQASAHHER